MGSRSLLPPILLLFSAAFLFAAPPPSMEIVSRLGRQAEVIYSGEEYVFRVREVVDGVEGLFEGGRFLGGTTFTLREWPRVAQDAMGIAKGSNRRVVVTKKPAPDLWGAPPSSIVLTDRAPGRYVLEATREGCSPAQLTVHFAKLEIVSITAELGEHHYTASFGIRLVDPDEKAKRIPVCLESLDEEGRLIDLRRDPVFAPVPTHPGTFHLTPRVHVSSHTVEGFRDRLARAEKEHLPTDFLESQPLRVVEGGTLRIAFRTVHAVYPLPLGAGS